MGRPARRTRCLGRSRANRHPVVARRRCRLRHPGPGTPAGDFRPLRGAAVPRRDSGAGDRRARRTHLRRSRHRSSGARPAPPQPRRRGGEEVRIPGPARHRRHGCRHGPGPGANLGAVRTARPAGAGAAVEPHRAGRCETAAGTGISRPVDPRPQKGNVGRAGSIPCQQSHRSHRLARRPRLPRRRCRACRGHRPPAATTRGGGRPRGTDRPAYPSSCA